MDFYHEAPVPVLDIIFDYREAMERAGGFLEMSREWVGPFLQGNSWLESEVTTRGRAHHLARTAVACCLPSFHDALDEWCILQQQLTKKVDRWLNVHFALQFRIMRDACPPERVAMFVVAQGDQQLWVQNIESGDIAGAALSVFRDDALPESSYFCDYSHVRDRYVLCVYNILLEMAQDAITEHIARISRDGA